MCSANLVAKIFSTTACIGLLTACTSVSSVKEVTSDPSAYLAKKFVKASLSPSLVKKLPADDIRSGRAQISLVTESNYEAADGKKETWKNKITLIDLGQGVFQKTVEQSNNNIPFKVHYGLTYRGLMDLRWQSVPLRRSITEPLFEVKDVTRFDALPIAENQEFTVDYSSGNEVQIAGFFSARKSCKATRQLAAQDIHKKLDGKGLEIECQQFSNNLVENRSKWVFLQNYGIAIQTEGIGSAYKTIIRVIDVDE